MIRSSDVDSPGYCPATVIDQISYNEAMELAYFGAKVIHPQTMAPAVTHDIPIRIRNTFNPDHPGTRIASTADRREAIRAALEAAKPGDTVVLAGKGHESYQVVGTEKRPFDERAIAVAALRDLGVL